MSRPTLITLERVLLDLLGGGRDAASLLVTTDLMDWPAKASRAWATAFGVTRERIRQIVAAASARLRTERPVAQALDRTIVFMANRIPAATGVIDAGVIEAEMRSKRG